MSRCICPRAHDGDKAVPDTLLEVKNLRTYFSTQEGVVKAVDGVSFDLEEGESLGIVGESGSGKSTVAQSLLRLIPQPPGKVAADEILFQGKDLLRASDREMGDIRGRRISMVFQDPMTCLNPVLTIGEQINEGLQRHLGMGKEGARRRSVELLRMVGIPDASHRVKDYAHQFSGGMRQRIMIAMALSCNPKLLLADEPTTALDVTIQAQILHLIKKLSSEMGTAVILITHNFGVVAAHAQRVIVMYCGRIVESAPTRELFSTPSHPYTRGLLNCIPRLDGRKGAKLTPIEGLPADLTDLPSGCSFAPRCDCVQALCLDDRPPLARISNRHYAACWQV